MPNVFIELSPQQYALPLITEHALTLLIESDVTVDPEKIDFVDISDGTYELTNVELPTCPNELVPQQMAALFEMTHELLSLTDNSVTDELARIPEVFTATGVVDETSELLPSPPSLLLPQQYAALPAMAHVRKEETEIAVMDLLFNAPLLSTLVIVLVILVVAFPSCPMPFSPQQ
jgi:hypothetical protein